MKLRIRGAIKFISVMLGFYMSLGLQDVAWPQQVVPAPTGLTATTTSSSTIDLSWTNNSIDETAIIIERSKTGASGPFTRLIELPPGTQNYLNNGLLSVTQYWYRVHAVQGSIQSDHSNVDEATTSAQNPTLSPFSIIALPDTQRYAVNNPQIFSAQTQFIVENQAPMNIVFATQLGDCVENPELISEWEVADAAFSKLENPNPFDGTDGTGKTNGIPYGIAVGNHDQFPLEAPNPQSTTANYNLYFGESRFFGRAYYGGNDDGVNGHHNDNHFELFEGGGLKFIIVHIEYDPDGPEQSVLDWAKNVIQVQHPDRWAIIVTHFMYDSSDFSSQGQKIYDTLKDSPNLFLQLGAHKCRERRQTDVYNGNTVHTLLANYTCRNNGGDGWLRIMEFEPNADQNTNPGFTIHVKTFSPTLNQFETDSDSQFDLSFPATGPPGASPLTITPNAVSLSPGEQQVFMATGGSVASAFDYSITLETNNSSATLIDQGNGTATYTAGIITGVNDTVRLTDGNNNTVDATVNIVAASSTFPVILTLNGNGTVTSTPSGISCPGTCTAEFLENTQVVLTALPIPDSTFDGWSGANCSGTGTCSVTMTQAESVTVNFSLLPPDIETPVVNVVTPTNGETITGSVSLSATATDNVVVVGVQFLVNGTPVGPELTSAPWSLSWNSGTVVPGVYTVSAQARDFAGNTAVSPDVFVNIEAPPGFLQDSGPDGLLVVEAEHFHANVSSGTHSWNPATPGGFSGDSAMVTDPNTGTNEKSNYATSSPRLDYEVNFTQTGTHYVWIRGIGASQEDDSVHIGLNGQELTSSDEMSGFSTAWTWSNQTMDGPVATIQVPSLGNHTLNLWMREDGTIIDKILLTTNAAYPTPTGQGPPESLQGTPAPDTQAPVVTLIAPTSGDTLSGFIPLQATATDNVGVVGVQFLINGSPLGTEVTTAPWTIIWDATTAPTGTYLVSAQARDFAGNTATAPAVSVMIEPPPAPVLWPLTLTLDGSGSGTVTSNPGGVNCPGTCTTEFLNSTPVVLTAVAQADSSFDGWSGAGCSGTGTCTVTLAQAESVTALFSLLPPPPPQNILFSDNFDSGDLSAYGQISGNWSTISEPGKGLVLRQTTNAHTLLYAAMENFSGSYQVKAEIWNEDNDTAGLAFRVNPAAPNNLYSCNATADNGSQAGFWQYVDSLSNATLLAEEAWTYVRSRWYTVTITVDQAAQTLHCQWSSAEAGVEFEITVSDPEPLATGTIGIRLSSEDNFKGDLLEVSTLGAQSPPDTQAPLTSITSPTANQIVAGLVSLSATATDNVGVVGVQFLINGSPLGTELTTAPWTVTWDATTAPPGTYLVSARARDLANNTGTAPAVSVMIEPPPAPVLWLLTLTLDGSGHGMVTSNPSGVSCPGTCTAEFLNSTPVVLTAVPQADSAFDGWSGIGCSGTGPCTVTLTHAQSVTAMFSLLPPPPPQNTLFSDNFDSGNLGAYGQISGNWSTVSEPGRGLVLRQTTNAETILYPLAENFSGSYLVNAEIWNEDNDTAGIAFRVNPADPHYFYSCSAPADNGFQAGLWQHVNELSNTTMLAGASWNYVRSRWYTVTITVDQAAQTLHCQWSSAEAGVEFEVTVSDPAPSATGTIGIRLSSEDNFKGDLLEVRTLGPPPPPDVEIPTVTIVAPTDGTTVTGTVALSASATDNVGVVGVQFFVNGSLWGAELTSAPWTLAWNTASLLPGDYTLDALARDAAGNLAVAQEVLITVEAAPGFLQGGGPNALLVVEAEHFHANVASSTQSWIVTTPPGFSGDSAMVTNPNTGTNQKSNFATSSPRLDYEVHFTQTGTHYVWIRGMGASIEDDSVHIGLDGQALPSSDEMTGIGPTWTWSNQTMDGPVATMHVPSTGPHTLNLWMREDGTVIDKLVVTINPGYVPSALGPPESPLQ